MSAVKGIWKGYERYDFTVNGREALVVSPKEAAPGNPWVWRAEFFDAFSQVDMALLEQGWHLAYCNVSDMYGSPEAIELMHPFHLHVCSTFGLAEKPSIFGFSRGGLYAVNYALKYPESVSSLYLDAPVLDLRSWPGGNGKADQYKKEWEECLQTYRLTEEQFAQFRESPLDRVAELAALQIPVILVVGDADEDVPFLDNGHPFAERFAANGGEIEVIVKPGVAHHPHSLDDPTPVAEFIQRVFYSESETESIGAEWDIMSANAAKRIVFLGDSITDDGTYISYLDAFFRQHFAEQPYTFINLGVSSETASGLSEPDHPFPRPCIHERLERALSESRPDWTVICYGMNDGIYYPFSEERFAAYRDGMDRLIEAVRATGSKVIVMTPPPFDAPSLSGATLLPEGEEKYSYLTPFTRYDDVLERYAEWVLGLEAAVDAVIAIREPLLHYIAERKKLQFRLPLRRRHSSRCRRPLGHCTGAP
ncbi:alpha/beta fold hydrolase [Paenibacillus gorillae]|uniref:alpha/beta fold hydrolase n=1 Tax=Paenibacillus gorillae TaxID=1243662 RepID=UPI0004B9B11F|nr:alpha/beta fold hydrolase [Paenibacillus gorillae]